MAAGPVAYGQQWTLEASARANTVFPAASVYITDLTVYAFHLFDGASIKPLQYDVSTDGGQTFPTLRATAFSPVGNDDVFSARLTAAPSGALRVVLLLNASQCIAYSDTVLTLPTTSTWTQLTPPGSAGAPVGIGVRGTNVVVMLQDGGAAMKLAYSTDGAATFTASTGTPVENVTTPVGFQVFASPADGVWLLINPNSGKIYRSTDSGASWGASVKTITAGNAGLPVAACLYAVNATRVVAVYKGQVTTSDDAGLTWTDRQNLTLNPPSTTAIQQGGIAHIDSFGENAGVEVLGGATNYVEAFNSATTRGAMWRTVDLGTTWTLVLSVGGANHAGASMVTGFIARAGRGVIDVRSNGGPNRETWFNPNPAALGSIGADCGAAIVVEPCTEAEEA